jgi:hypothetical protein
MTIDELFAIFFYHPAQGTYHPTLYFYEFDYFSLIPHISGAFSF